LASKRAVFAYFDKIRKAAAPKDALRLAESLKAAFKA
jgi:hypothetical protein